MKRNVNHYATEESRWRALVQHEKAAAGKFVYGVVTTGIYCRPGCPSKLPNRENVRFFETPKAAENAGFRPCKRCTPQDIQQQDPHREIIIQACRHIEAAEIPPTLQELADSAGLSASYFHRIFKKIVGVTPKQYIAQKRTNRVRSSLQTSATVTEAIYDAGFSSSSRFYEKAIPTLGMSPSTYRNGGQGARIHFAILECYLGWVLVAATEKGICNINFADTPGALEARLRVRFPHAELVEGNASFTAWVEQVLAFLESPHSQLELPLDIQGTAFQRRVWMALQDIPMGETASYAEIAARIGNPKAARAVAQACSANSIAVAIPCHRVVRSDGKLGGYRWGSERKRQLLEREATKADR